MSGTFPSSPAPARLSIRALQPSFVSVTHSLASQRRSRGVHRWAFELAWPTLRRSEIATLVAFLEQQRDEYSTFSYVLPRLSSARGALGGTPLVNSAGGYAVGTTSIALDGASNNVTGWVLTGDFVKFAGHAKVYRVTADANSNGSGQVTASIWPPLLSAVADNEAATLADVPFTVRLASPMPEYRIEPGLFAQFDSLALIEEPF